MAAKVDTAVGKVIDELKRQGVYDKTRLIFTIGMENMGWLKNIRLKNRFESPWSFKIHV